MNTSKELSKTLGELIDELSAVPLDKINTIPFEGSWTAAQLAQHLIKSYGVIQVIHGHATPTQREPDENFKQIAKIFLDFSTKLQSPDFIVPEEQEYDKDALLKSLQQTKHDTENALATLDLTMTCEDFALPGMATKFTRLEWLYFMMCHTQRHIRQLKNIKQHLQ
jgi:hypothetical protein